MNKKIILLTAAFLMTVSVLFAQEIKSVPKNISTELQKEFKHPENVQWKMVNTLYKATFTLDGQAIEAFYSSEGTLTAVSRKLSVDQLPLVLIKEVKEKAMYYGISDLFELLTEKGTEYFLVLNSDKETRTYKSEGYSWTRY